MNYIEEVVARSRALFKAWEAELRGTAALTPAASAYEAAADGEDAPGDAGAAASAYETGSAATPERGSEHVYEAPARRTASYDASYNAGTGADATTYRPDALADGGGTVSGPEARLIRALAAQSEGALSARARYESGRQAAYVVGAGGFTAEAAPGGAGTGSYRGGEDAFAFETAWPTSTRGESEALSARALSARFERDARRYDGGFSLY